MVYGTSILVVSSRGGGKRKWKPGGIVISLAPRNVE